MKINRNNYEAWFIDYLEGNLDVKLVDDFMEFLQQNPDLKEELSQFEAVSIEQEEITFSKKENLFKIKYDVELEFNQAAIASIEGEISASEKAEFDNYLSAHPEKQKEVELFTKTKLQPDETVVFGRKNKLFRQTAGKTILLWTTRVAAVVIVALSVYIFIDQSSNKIIPENQVASLEKSIDKKEINTDKKEVTANDMQVTIKEIAAKPAVKNAQTKSPTIENLTENLERLPENEYLALSRIPTEIPAELQGLSASIAVTTTETGLVPVKIKVPETTEMMYDEKLFVDVIREKTGIGKLTFNKITKAGLSLVASLSKEKFKYETNTDGKVTELKYDSRLLAFSIPTRIENAGK